MPWRDAVEILEMSEKGILGSKAQAVGEAEERVFDNGNRRAGTKGKRRKEPTSPTVVRKEASVSKARGKATRMGEDPPVGKVAEVLSMKGMPFKVLAEVLPMKVVPPKVLAEVLPMKVVPPKVLAEVPSLKAMSSKGPAEVPSLKAMSSKGPAEVPSMATPMPTKSLDVSCWRKDNKESYYIDNDKPFHIPLLRDTRGG